MNNNTKNIIIPSIVVGSFLVFRKYLKKSKK